MMASMTAREYKEWEAYERALGPLDSTYEREMIAELHELLQVNNLLTGASLTKKGKKNPAGKFRKATRAHQLYLPEDSEEEQSSDEHDEFDDYYEEEDWDDDDGDEEVHVTVDPDAYDPAKDPFADPSYQW